MNNAFSTPGVWKAKYFLTPGVERGLIKQGDFQVKRENLNVPFLIGDKAVLRLIEENDINKRYLSWLNDKEITRYMDTGTFPTSLRELKDFYGRIANSKNDVMFAIVSKKNNLHIGNIKLGGINWIHRYADLGIMIGDKRYWGKGYGREACCILLEYAFHKLNLNKVILGVYSIHKSAISAYMKVGLRIEGRIENMLYIDGRYIDKLIMGISRKDFDRKNRG